MTYFLKPFATVSKHQYGTSFVTLGLFAKLFGKLRHKCQVHIPSTKGGVSRIQLKIKGHQGTAIVPVATFEPPFYGPPVETFPPPGNRTPDNGNEEATVAPLVHPFSNKVVSDPR